MTPLILRLVKWIIRKWLKGYHLSRNAPKGLKRSRKEGSDSERSGSNSKSHHATTPPLVTIFPPTILNG